MLGNTFYYKLIRKAVLAYGAIFNNIQIQRTDANNTTVQTIVVPLTYAKKQKFLEAVLFNQDKESRPFEIQLPRMSFEITNYQYMPQRKLQSNQTPNKYVVKPLNDPANTEPSLGIPTPTIDQLTSAFPPAPYELTFKLYILTKNQDDMLQIFEQIVPFFNPSYNVVVKWIPELNVTKDFPITLVEVSTGDTYEGSLSERREILWELTFKANIEFYGPAIASAIIKKVDVNFYNDINKDVKDISIKYHCEVNPLSSKPTDNYTFLESFDEQNFT